MTDEEQRRIFGVNLSYQISISGKMQKEIALDLDVNQTTMSMWCTGKSIPRVSMVQKIADYFGIGKSQLVDPQDYSEEAKIELTEHEKKLIRAYRKMSPEAKGMIDRLLVYTEEVTHEKA